jgi:hypothetical protein
MIEVINSILLGLIVGACSATTIIEGTHRLKAEKLSGVYLLIAGLGLVILYILGAL